MARSIYNMGFVVNKAEQMAIVTACQSCIT